MIGASARYDGEFRADLLHRGHLLRPQLLINEPENANTPGTVPQLTACLDQKFLHLLSAQHRQRGELVKAERRCRQALYLAPNLLPALELLQILWSEHPNLRLRRALRERVQRHRLPRTAASEAAAIKENA